MVLKGLGASLLVILGVSPVLAQEAAAPTGDPAVTVSIGDTAAPPEWELSVPVTLAIAKGSNVGRLSMRLEYPARALRYVSVRGTDTLKTAGFEVRASPPATTSDVKGSAPAARDKEQTGELGLEFRPAAGSGEKTLPSARVAIVVFKVLVDAQAKSWPLTPKDVQAWGAGPAAAEVKTAAAPAAKFTVSPAGLPIFGCFFYMH